MSYRPIPIWTWIGLGGLVTTEILLLREVWFVTRYFTPLVWSFYILFADGLTARRKGSSPFSRNPLECLAVALASIGIWYIFEGYNLRMDGWRYVGLPEVYWHRLIGYFWSFATIAPGVLVTAELIDSVLPRAAPAPRPAGPLSRGWFRLSLALGAICLIAPIVLPREVGRYLWAPVWAGLIFLIDPINERLGRTSLMREVRAGDTRRLWTLLAAGLVCGILWEFWNYWAHAKWIYTFPFPWLRDAKLFEMPIAGFLGFPPFAVELFVMVELLSALWRGSADIQRRH